jgi:hypothetical protein
MTWNELLQTVKMWGCKISRDTQIFQPRQSRLLQLKKNTTESMEDAG